MTDALSHFSAPVRDWFRATFSAPTAAQEGAWESIRNGNNTLIIAPTDRQAEDLAAALRSYLPAADIALFPAWETLPHERLSPRSDTVGRRLQVLRAITGPAASRRVCTSGSIRTRRRRNGNSWAGRRLCRRSGGRGTRNSAGNNTGTRAWLRGVGSSHGKISLQ